MESKIQQIYTQYNYPPATRLYKLCQRAGIHATLKEVKQFLLNQDVHQIISKPTAKPPRAVTAQAFGDIVFCDLIIYDKYSGSNRGYKYIMLAIDVFTRRAYAYPIKTKSSNETVVELQRLHEEVPINLLMHDDGKEWMGAFGAYCDDNDINQFSFVAKDHHRAFGVIDALTKTIKHEIYKHMLGNNTTNWVDALDSIIQLYNENPHSGIDDIAPADALKPEARAVIGTINIAKILINKWNKQDAPSFTKGSTVRVKQSESKLSKGENKGYSKEVFEVEFVDEKSNVQLTNGKYYRPDMLMLTTAPQTSQIHAIDFNTKKAQRARRLKRAFA